MNIESFNHLCGYFLLVVFLVFLFNRNTAMHNVLVCLFWIAVGLWATTGMFLIFG